MKIKTITQGFFLSICLLFSVITLNAQTTVFMDDLNRASITPGGSPQTDYTITYPTGANVIIETQRLKMVSAPAAPAGAAGRAIVVGNLSAYSSPFNVKLSDNTSAALIWTFNMRHNFNNVLAGFHDNTRGTATILLADGSDLTTANGYAVVMGGESPSVARYRLVKFSGGLSGVDAATANAKLSLMVNGQTLGTTTNDWRSYVSIKVIYVPSTGMWYFYDRKDASFGDASVNDGYILAGTSSDNTYTGTTMTNFGFLLNHTASATGIISYYYNYKVVASPVIPNDVPTAISKLQANNFSIKEFAGGFSLATEAANVKVFDSMGKMLANKQINGTFDFTTSTKGLYVVHIKTLKGFDVIKHVVK